MMAENQIIQLWGTLLLKFGYPIAEKFIAI